IQSFVRVYNPQARRWGPAQQVDIGESSNGQDRNGSTVVGISGDRAVTAVWGGSDRAADGTEGGLWTSTSTDYGAHWSAPRRLAEGGDWTIQTRAWAVAGIDARDLGDFGVNVRALTFARPLSGGAVQMGIVFMFSGRNRASAYALTSLDGGASWGMVEPIAFR